MCIVCMCACVYLYELKGIEAPVCTDKKTARIDDLDLFFFISDRYNKWGCKQYKLYSLIVREEVFYLMEADTYTRKACLVSRPSIYIYIVGIFWT